MHGLTGRLFMIEKSVTGVTIFHPFLGNVRVIKSWCLSLLQVFSLELVRITGVFL